MDDRATFGVVDYCVVIATLVISFGIGIGTTFKGNKSPEEFLLGNRSLATIPVGLSLLTSFISSINFIGFVSEVYAYGIQISMLVAGSIVGITLAGVITLPVIHNLEMTSINEYVELRFHSPTLRICLSGYVFFQAAFFMGVCVYAPSLVLATVTPIDFKTYIFIMSSISTVYSMMGGIRAVVWTDVFQFFIMTVGLIIIIIAAVVQMGVEDIISIAKEGGRMEFNMNPSIYERHNVYNTFFFGMFIYGQLYGIAQINVQRLCAVRTIKDARKVLGINMIGTVVIHGIIFFGGLATYASYAGCDPLLAGKIKKKDEILSYFIIDKLAFVPGLPGIFVSTIIATTLSTFSSVVNAQTAIIWKDWLAKLKIFSTVKAGTAVLINKVLTLLIGILFIGMGILTSKTQSIIQLILTTGGITFGTVYGVFILGMFFPTSNLKGAWSGFLVSCAFLIWIYGGSVLYLNPPEMLPLSMELCEDVSANNLTIYDIQPSSNTLLVHLNGSSSAMNITANTAENFPLEYLYGISYTLYPIIGPVLCIIIGLLVSYVTGSTDPKDVSPELIAPCLRKFYMKVDAEKENKENLEINTRL